MTARRIALLGAESTGKTQLAADLAAHWRARGRRVTVVDEVLREWCAREGRTPRPEEQEPIAREQERRVDAAAAGGAEIVIADTTAVMVAVYSAMLFADGSLLQFALQRQQTYHATLVTGLDLPWVADGLQRDGPHVRPPVDAQVRELLALGGVPFQVVYGSGPGRLAHALRALGEAEDPPDGDGAALAAFCERCGDGTCERHLFTRLMRARGASGP